MGIGRRDQSRDGDVDAFRAGLALISDRDGQCSAVRQRNQATGRAAQGKRAARGRQVAPDLRVQVQVACAWAGRWKVLGEGCPGRVGRGRPLESARSLDGDLADRARKTGEAKMKILDPVGALRRIGTDEVQAVLAETRSPTRAACAVRGR